MLTSQEKFKASLSQPNAWKVYADKGEDAYRITLNIMNKLNLDLDILRKKKIIIKPNAGRLVPPHTGIDTNPEVIAGIADFLLANNVKDLMIAESPILGVNALEAIEKCGIGEIAALRNIPLFDLDSEKPVIVEIPDFKVVDKLKVCKKIIDADYIISVPVMKTHMHTQVSLGLKNMKGCLYRREKVKLHQLPSSEKIHPPAKSLDMAIADLSKILQPDLTVIDGTIGLEGLGPSAGSPKKSWFIVASENCLAADITAAQLMGIIPEDIHHLRLSVLELFKDEVSFSDFRNKIELSPSDALKWMDAFEPPPQKISLKISNVVVEDIESCSACLSSVLMFLKRYEKNLADYFTTEKPLKLALGKGIGKQQPDAILIGNCALQKQGGCIRVKGCPPVASEILKSMEKCVKCAQK